MAHTLAPDRERGSIALAAVLLTVFAGGTVGQIGAIVLGAVAGLWLCRRMPATTVGHLAFPVRRMAGAFALVLFAILLVLTPVLVTLSGWQAVALFDAFSRSGALVFGGGHVVLPLLRAEVVDTGWVTPDAFLAGYGAAQAVPGPLFTFAAYLGVVMMPAPHGIWGALIALIGVFLPGLLLVYGMLPFWDALRTRPMAQAAMRGTNAAVVGILGAAFYDPVWTSAVLSPRDFALALVAFVLLTLWRTPPWVIVVLMAISGAAIAGFL